MLEYDIKIISAVEQLNTITDKIIETLLSEDIQLDYVDELYNSREEHIGAIKEFLADENSKVVIENSKENWNNLMDNLRSKDEKALGLLKNKVKYLEDELKTKEKQKNILLYRENL